LEWQLRGNVIIRKAQKAIQAGECSPRRRFWPRFPLLAPVKRGFITNVKGTFFGMSESEEASKRR
jgi:hypothetical protein